jgi:hypothetical protein
MAANSEDRIAQLGKLLKGKIRADWTLLDESYREPFDELMWLLNHRESVVVSMMYQRAKGRTKRNCDYGRSDDTGVQVVQ